MGTKDTKTKKYMSSPEHFADAFNYFLYEGRQVIRADHLIEVDPTEVGIVWENDSEEIVQKYRDVLKSCVIKCDRQFTYVYLGIENQSDIHYAMPVKNMVYDALNYGRQVEKFAKVHRKKKDLSGDEFLSGFSKTDKIKPVITLTIYFGADDWDGPRCLLDMMDPFPSEIVKFINDYTLNLIVPKEIEDFSRFSTELKNVLQFIASSEDKAAIRALSTDTSYEHLSVETVSLINECTRAGIPIKEGEKEVNMCKGMQELFVEERAEGRAEGRVEGRAEGRAEGREIMIFELVQDGDYSIQQGAKKLGISVTKFEQRMEAAGYKIPLLL